MNSKYSKEKKSCFLLPLLGSHRCNFKVAAALSFQYVGLPVPLAPHLHEGTLGPKLLLPERLVAAPCKVLLELTHF